jgi:hypothetical protein
MAPSEANEGREHLFPAGELDGLRARWSAVQTSFVDEPRRAVEEADQLVASIIQRVVETFADQRQKLETEWGRGEEVSTEDLRQSLRKYRSFFDRLLTV